MSTEPITLTVTVGCDVASAFELWTEELASWWPFEGHSLGGTDRVTGAVFEGRVGGRLYEVWEDGSERTWAEIERWDPPAGFALAWHPGTDSDTATRVEVDFTPSTKGGTEVRLVHRDWDRRPDAADARASYATGWQTVLGAYVDNASSRIH